jgi:DNA-binding phage protein
MRKTPVTEDAVLSAVLAERTAFEAVLQTIGAVERIGGMVSIAARFPVMLTNRLRAISA